MKKAGLKLKITSIIAFVVVAAHAKANQQPDKIEKQRYDITKPALNFSVFKLFTVQPQLKDSIEKSYKLERNPQPKIENERKAPGSQSQQPVFFIDKLRSYL